MTSRACPTTARLIAMVRAADVRRGLQLGDDEAVKHLLMRERSASLYVVAMTRVGWQRALDLLGAMAREMLVDVISFTAALGVCDRCSQWEQAVRLFRGMPSASLQPNLISLSSTITACKRGRQWQLAIAFFAGECLLPWSNLT